MSLQHLYKAFSDGELSIAERRLVEKELESNEAVRKEIEDLRRLSKSIREYVTQPEPSGLEATLAAIETAKPKAKQQRAMFQQLRWVAWTAAAVVGVGLVCMVFFPVFAQSRYQARSVSALAEKKANAFAMSPMPPGETTTGTTGSTATGTGGGDGMADARADTAFKGAAGGAVPGGPPLPERAKANDALGGGAGRHLGGNSGSSGRGSNSAANGANAFNGAPPSDGEINPQSAVGLATPASPTPHRAPQLIEKTAGLTVKVKNIAEAQQAVEMDAKAAGGWVQESNRSEAEGQAGTATITIRVPVSQFENTLKAIRALGDVTGDSSSGNDVTGDVVDMDARLKVLRAEEADYMILLGRARRTGEIMEIRDKLTEIRTEIESTLGQRNMTKDQAAFSTINVSLTQRPSVGDHSSKSGDGADSWLGDTWATAVNGLSAAGRVLGQLLIFTLVWAPIWVPTALAGAWLYRKLKW